MVLTNPESGRGLTQPRSTDNIRSKLKALGIFFCLKSIKLD